MGGKKIQSIHCSISPIHEENLTLHAQKQACTMEFSVPLLSLYSLKSMPQRRLLGFEEEDLFPPPTPEIPLLQPIFYQ